MFMPNQVYRGKIYGQPHEPAGKTVNSLMQHLAPCRILVNRPLYEGKGIHAS